MASTILVLGGGFGGLAAVHRLRALLGPEPRIVLVDRNDGFAMGFAKLWDLAGMRPMAQGTRPLANVAAHGVEFVQADITAIDAANRSVTTSAGTFEGDALLVALGAVSAPPHLAMLAHDNAHDLYDPASLAGIHRDLDAITGGRVVVSILGGPHKCPPAPFEAALIVSRVLEARGVRDDVEVVMTTPKPMTLPVAGPDASRFVADRLVDHGIELVSGHRVAAVDGLTVQLAAMEGGATRQLDADVLLGVPANVAPPLLRGHDLVGESGWIEVDRHTMATGVEGVWAVGDCTMIPTANGELPMAGVFAAATARVAAANIAAHLGVGQPEAYDGHGFCFLELPDEKVAYVEGDFYGQPPQVVMTEADHEQFLRKQAYEREHLDLWLPA